MVRKKTLILISVLVIFSAHLTLIHAQDAPDTTEVGIYEHLDAVIPMELTFTDENNHPVVLKDLITKPTILVLIYFDCPGICPTILASVSDVIERIDMRLGTDYQVVTVSFNPVDGPDRAKNKKNQFLRKVSRQNPSAWTYLTGDSASIHKLTNAVGFRFQQAGNDFIHPACITVLSPQGKITRYLYGTTFLPFDVKMALIEAEKGLSRPTISRVLDFCYTYDPAGRRYSLEVTKLSGIIILFLIAIFAGVMIIRTKVKNKRKNDSRI